MATTPSQGHRIKSATIRLLTPTIVENIVHDHTEVDASDIREIKEINKQLTRGANYAVLVDSGVMTSITEEARLLSADKEFQEQTIAKALLIHSLGHRLVGRFYIQVNKPHIKTKIFSDRDQAIAWLKHQVNSHNNPALPRE